MKGEQKPGAVVAARYTLDRKIGEGGMGAVWKAVQEPTKKAVALKFMRSSASDAERKRFMREARAACAVRHPNVVEIYDVIELEDGAPVMVMEYLEGHTFEHRLVGAGKVPTAEVGAVVGRVVSAVGAAHALGIVHRDLKPENIFLAKTKTGVEVKVLDFGIAKFTASEGDAAQTAGLTSTGAMLGTPFYMAPEQAFGERDIDRRADIWSLGIILYRALSGTLPTEAENLGQILKIILAHQIQPLTSVAPEVPPDLAALVDRMLSAKRAERPSDLREVAEVLARHGGPPIDFGAPTAELAEDAPDAAPAAPMPESARTPHKGDVRPRARWPYAVGALGLTLGVGLFAWWVTLGADPTPGADAAPSGAEAGQEEAPTDDDEAEAARDKEASMDVASDDRSDPGSDAQALANDPASPQVEPAAAAGLPATAKGPGATPVPSPPPDPTTEAADPPPQDPAESMGGVVEEVPF